VVLLLFFLLRLLILRLVGLVDKKRKCEVERTGEGSEGKRRDEKIR